MAKLAAALQSGEEPSLSLYTENYIVIDVKLSLRSANITTRSDRNCWWLRSMCKCGGLRFALLAGMFSKCNTLAAQYSNTIREIPSSGQKVCKQKVVARYNVIWPTNTLWCLGEVSSYLIWANTQIKESNLSLKLADII